MSAASSRQRRLTLATRATWSWLTSVLGPFLGLLVIVLIFHTLTQGTGTFLTVFNWETIAVQTVIVGTAALGMTLIMIAGGIDLSVGSSVALTTVAVGVLLRDQGVALPLALAAGVALGGLLGLVNGAVIIGLGLLPFIVTLGTMKMYRGAAKWLSESTAVYMPEESKTGWFGQLLAINPTPSEWTKQVPAQLEPLARFISQMAPGVWLLLGLTLVVSVVLRYSVLGRYIHAIGSNEPTARLCGIAVGRVKLTVYGLAGLLTGLAGVLQFAYLDGTGDPVTADGLELQVIAAVVIGGGSLSGGEGTVLGTLIGCLFMSVLSNGCVHAGFPNAMQDVLIGLIIILAVALDRLRRLRQAV